MLHVLTVSTLFPNAAQPNFGGFVAEQTRRLAAREDVRLKVVAPLGVPPPPLDRLPRYAPLRDLPEREDWRGLDVLRPRFTLIPQVGWRLNPLAIERTLARTLAELRAERFVPDVIDGEFFYPCGVAAARVGRRFRIPVSLKARGSDIHYWSRFDAARAAIVEAGTSASGLLAVSEAMKRDMTALGMPASRIRVHLTGVDLDRFRNLDRAAAKRALGVDGPLVVSIGNLIPLKGHDIVIRAMASLPDATLIVAGAGPEEMALRVAARRAGVAPRVRFAGSVPHDRVPELLAAADVMALASEREGLANVWVEALAAGTPIVIPAIGSAREVVVGPQVGRVVSERTPDAFAKAIRILLDYPPPPDVVRRAAERFSWERNTQTLFEHLAGLRRAAAPEARVA